MFRVKVVVVKYAKVMMHWHCHGYATNANLKPFHEIPSPKGALPFVGTLFSLMAAGGAENLHEYINERHKQLGAVFRERLGPVTSIFLNDADEIRKVFSLEGRYPKHVLPECWLLYNKTYSYQRGLYFMDGTEWFKYRKILNDVLLKRDYYAEAKKNAIFVEQAFEIWYENSKRGQIIDLENELYNLSLIFIMSFAFGSCFHENADVFLPRIRQLSAVVREIFLHSVKLSVIPATLAMSLNLKIWSDFSQAVGQSVRYTTDLLNELISYKKKKEEDEDADGVVFHLMKRKIDANTLQRIVVDLIMAAGDTNAYASLWIFYLLARHKDVQSELYADIQQRGDTETARPSPMIRNVIKESMRLYPVAPFIARYLPEETCVCSYRVPANQLISLSMYNCSRNEKYFPNAEQFQPHRWQRLPDGRYVAVLDAYASLPFAMGARSCVGRNLSMAQLHLTINKLVSAFEIDALNRVQVKLNLITVPSEPIRIRLSKR